MKKPNLSYLVIPLAVIAIAAAGSAFTTSGLGWYRTLRLPTWTPPGQAIGAVWTTIFALAAASALIAWNRTPRGGRLAVAVTYAANGALNVLWSLLFFGLHLMGPATAEAALLEVSVIAVMAVVWRTSRLAAALLVPYAAWVVFATYLSFRVWTMNL